MAAGSSTRAEGTARQRIALRLLPGRNAIATLEGMSDVHTLGPLGERLAEQHLTHLGYHLIERNWRTTAGELDLIMRDGEEIVFVEVKTRAALGYGHPLEAITRDKLRRVRQLAAEWCRVQRAAGVAIGPIRIDAVAVLAPADAPARIEHLAGIDR